MDDYHREQLREIIDHGTRLVEALDALRERASLVQDEVATRFAEQGNAAMYRLSIIAPMHLPLSLFTGLLGVNVAGIPGRRVPLAFWGVGAGLPAMAVLTIWIIERYEDR